MAQRRAEWGYSRAGRVAKIAQHALGRTQAARPLEPVLGRVTMFLYSLRKSSSGVGFWKNSIHGFIISTDM
jgi:hypothetical protein